MGAWSNFMLLSMISMETQDTSPSWATQWRSQLQQPNDIQSLDNYLIFLAIKDANSLLFYVNWFFQS